MRGGVKTHKIKTKAMSKSKVSPYVYFIEEKVSRLWLEKIEGYDNHTKDPNKAMLFLTIEAADAFIKENDLADYYFSTEHEFNP